MSLKSIFNLVSAAGNMLAGAQGKILTLIHAIWFSVGLSLRPLYGSMLVSSCSLASSLKDYNIKQGLEKWGYNYHWDSQLAD